MITNLSRPPISDAAAGQIPGNPPPNPPKRAEKTYTKLNDDANPQSKNAAIELPIPLARITYGYGYESHSRPKMMKNTTDVALNNARETVDDIVADEREDVYVGINKLTGKYDRA